MKAKIISAFIDRITRKYYNIGEIIEVDEVRFNELVAKNKIEPYGEETIEAKAEVLKPKKKKLK